MIPLSFSLVWVAELFRSVLWFCLIVVVATGLLPWFLPVYHPLRISVEMMGSPLLRRPRRWLARASRQLRFDLAPWLLALLLLLLDRLVLRTLAWWAYMMNPSGFGLSVPWAEVLRLLLYGFIFLVLLRVILSWFRTPMHHPFVQWVVRLTNPPLRFTRRLLPLHWGTFDLSPLLLLAVLSFVDRVVLATLVQWSLGIR